MMRSAQVLRSKPLTRLTPFEAAPLLSQYDTFFFDCDGVLWRGDEAIPGAKEVIDAIHTLGKRAFFVTNNSTNSRRSYQHKFSKFGMHVDASEILCSAYAAAMYLQMIDFKGKVFVVGESGIYDELATAGIACAAPLTAEQMSPPSGTPVLEVDSEVDAVVVGLDRFVNYTKFAYAQHYLRNPETLFVATNNDSTFPSHHHLLPGAGTIVSAIECCSARRATVVGKPSRIFVDILLNRFPDLVPSRCLMIGDRLDTDIAFGKAAGFGTLLVETGINSLADAQQATLPPDFVVPSVAHLLSDGGR